ncbi:MAG: 50S ribosomal protein L29 [Gammaproteobacteria bacterium]|jgi:large subunit ribosomal protein L29|nr:50S ribosomal protein L29 [Gammaproteobacteria bacterium]
MKASEMRAKSPADLKALLLEKRKEQFNLRMQRGAGQVVRPSEVRAARKDIARIKTILGQKKTGGA